MSEETNKELKGQATAQEVIPEEAAVEKVTAEESVETMEDFVAELEVSYQTLNKGKIKLTEEESGTGAKWVQFQQMMGDRTIVKMKISKAVKGGVVITLEEVRTFIPASQLSTEYVEKLED